MFATAHRILVTGATGFVASQLVPRLLERGHVVRAMARRPQQLALQPWSRSVECVAGDMLQPQTLGPALQGVHTAYYLVHSLASGRGYTDRDLVGARNFARAAADAGVQHIIYLGGLADAEQSPSAHLRSRIETGATLRQGPVPVTEFRCGVIAGAGSLSFEMIRRITEVLPLIPGPAALHNRTQPIAARNAVDYLLAALDHPQCRGQVFEIGGPEVTTYAELMLGYARVRGLQRRVVVIPGLPLWMIALGSSLLARVPHGFAHAVLGSLRNDSVVAHPEALRAFPEVKLIDYATASSEAVAMRRRTSGKPVAGAVAGMLPTDRIAAIGRSLLAPHVPYRRNATTPAARCGDIAAALP